jgi:hypothetical protein
VEDTNISDGYALADVVEINLNMLGALMLDGVGGEVYHADIVIVDQGYLGFGGGGGVSSRCSWQSQHASATLLVTARYSALTIEGETTFWHFEDQETRLLPRNTT